MHLRQVSLPLLALSLLAACGKSSNDRSTASSSIPEEQEVNQNEVTAADGSNINGFYAGELVPVNHNLHFKKVGMAGLERSGDSFTAYIRLTTGPKITGHKQAVYTGRRCPTLNDDLNKDAFVDMKEAQMAIGQVTIPLDANLDSQEGGMNQYPAGDATGKYFYSQMASFDRLFSDLKSPDVNMEDNVIKIGQDEGLTFPGRVILIQGVSDKLLLPRTIAVEGDESPHASLPVACAILWKVPSKPVEFEQNPSMGHVNP